MNLNEYQSAAHALSIIKPEVLIHYTALGVNEEVGEVLEYLLHEDEPSWPDVAKELGDVMWYIAECAFAWGVPFERFERFLVSDINDSYRESAISLAGHAAKIAGLTKKLIRDADGVIEEDRRQKVISHLGSMIVDVDNIARYGDYTLSEVMELNIEKLTTRKEKGLIKGDGSNREVTA